MTERGGDDCRRLDVLDDDGFVLDVHSVPWMVQCPDPHCLLCPDFAANGLQ